ncbi:MAG: GNAT family N-acetyltransferase [Fimbriimonadales bacterium]|nr:GNAT family N-acetyltransferase [Fimbriimonadales bacterium]
MPEPWWGTPGRPGATEVAVEGARAWMALDPFDSECFGFPMAKIEAAEGDERCSRELFREAVRRAGEIGWRHLAVRVPDGRPALAQSLERAGFFWVDATVVFERSLVGFAAEADPQIAPAAEGQLRRLQAIARGAFAQSRYQTDPHLPPEGARRLTDAWVANLWAGRADLVLVADPVHPVGFVACLFDPARRSAQIDLIAVAEEGRGRGVGRRLVLEACRHYSGRADRLEVGTQLANLGAVRLYEACGCRLARSALTFHWAAPDLRARW